jgi:hypothetical protein
MTERTHSSISQWKDEGFKLPRDFHYRNESESSRRHVEFASSIVSIRPHIESRVSTHVDELIAGGEDSWLRAAAEYHPMMERIAKSLSPGFTTAALERRKQIASSIPDMEPKTKTAQKQGRKKGGDK